MKKILLVDDNSYTFTEKGVMNYKVYFNFKLDKE